MRDSLRFAELEIHGVKHLGDIAVICPDEEADHFSLYGALPNRSAYVCIGDFSTRDAAELTKELLGY